MIVVGIDVSKQRLDVALLRPDGQRVYSRKFANSVKGAEQLLAWVCEKREVSPEAVCAVMEATGPYHDAAAYTLHAGGARVIVANPKRVRDYAKGLGLLTKTDTVDARVLAYYGANERIQRKLTPWQPPSLQIRTLSALLTRLAAVEKDLRRERNRLEKTQAGVVPAPAAVLDSLHHSIEALEAEQARLKREIASHYERHPALREERELLKSIPAVGDATSGQMLRVLKTHEFASARQAAAFCNQIPRQHESGSSVRAPARMAKGDPHLRAVLYMSAVVAIRHNPELKRFYERLCQRGKPKMSAIGAVMRKLIHIAYGVLKHHTPYDPALVTTA